MRYREGKVCSFFKLRLMFWKKWDLIGTFSIVFFIFWNIKINSTSKYSVNNRSIEKLYVKVNKNIKEIIKIKICRN